MKFGAHHWLDWTASNSQGSWGTATSPALEFQVYASGDLNQVLILGWYALYQLRHCLGTNSNILLDNKVKLHNHVYFIYMYVYTHARYTCSFIFLHVSTYSKEPKSKLQNHKAFKSLKGLNVTHRTLCGEACPVLSLNTPWLADLTLNQLVWTEN